MNFNDKLRKILKEKSISRYRLSITSEIPYTTIMSFFDTRKGTENIKLSTLKKLSKALDVSVDYLINDEINDDTFYNSQKIYAPLLIKENNTLVESQQGVFIFNTDNLTNFPLNYFSYESDDDSMAPLLGVKDIAIIKKDSKYIKGKTYLVKYNDNFLIRKIYTVENGIELLPTNPYYPVIKTIIDEIAIVGRVIRVQNSSAFK